MTLSSLPRVSVITIYRNEERFIKDTITSLLKQSFRDFECILIDGRSTDRSTAIIHELIQDDPRFILRTQASKGIANAFNEGLALARGQFVLFLNGGDFLSEDSSLETMTKGALQDPQAIHTYSWQCVTEQGEVEPKVHPSVEFKPEQLLWSNTICHHATLIPRVWFVQLGGYVPSLRISMDYEFWLRAFKAGVKYVAYSERVTYMRHGGVSSQDWPLSRTEVIVSRVINFGFFRPSLVKDLGQIILIIGGMGKRFLTAGKS